QTANRCQTASTSADDVAAAAAPERVPPVVGVEQPAAARTTTPVRQNTARSLFGTGNPLGTGPVVPAVRPQQWDHRVAGGIPAGCEPATPFGGGPRLRPARRWRFRVRA